MVKAFNEVAAHDVQWGEMGVEWFESSIHNMWKATLVCYFPSMLPFHVLFPILLASNHCPQKLTYVF